MQNCGLDDTVFLKYEKIKWKKQQEYDKIKCVLKKKSG